ncbi:ATP-dependent DNA helicase PIF1-like [Hydra vulgaris]|uniref:ATP-dependent DNA helicase n=1 Tax=Hydra vulgaris TaxID=6087 RepID=A0ABM4CLA2_HYDVU
MQLTENDLEFLMEKIYQFNQAHPATLEDIRMHAISSRKILCRRCKWHEDVLNHVKEKCEEIENCKHYLNECEECDEYRMNKIRENHNKKMFKMMIKQNLLPENEMMVAKFLVNEPDDLYCKVEQMNNINENKKMLEKIINMNFLLKEIRETLTDEEKENCKTLTDEEMASLKFLLDENDSDFLFKIRTNLNQIIKKMLSLQQQKALQWLDEGKNFFITGGVGCGKSYIVNQIAQSEQIYKTIHITASTGKASYLINGITIHAFAGIETGVKSVDYYKRHMHPDIKKTWLETDVLIIDEISMIKASTFDLLHSIACEIRQCYDELFGGVQVIACGDFFQLPPVSGQFVFKSQIWQHYMTEVLVLTQCFRQKDDEQFFGALNELRVGQVSDKTIDYFMTRCFEKDENLNSKYTRLFFRNIEVDVYNNQKMETIKQEGYWFYAKDVIKNRNIPCSFQIPAAVYLKIGATVMLVRNINVEEGLCNGTIGTVILIESNAVWVMLNKKEVKIEYVKEEILDCSHAVVGSRFGLPLKLAFSFTVHKAQGSTMPYQAVVQFNSKAFINSLYYVSLSRVCNIDDIFIIINNKFDLRTLFFTDLFFKLWQSLDGLFQL